MERAHACVNIQLSKHSTKETQNVMCSEMSSFGPRCRFLTSLQIGRGEFSLASALQCCFLVYLGQTVGSDNMSGWLPLTQDI